MYRVFRVLIVQVVIFRNFQLSRMNLISHYFDMNYESAKFSA